MKTSLEMLLHAAEYLERKERGKVKFGCISIK